MNIQRSKKVNKNLTLQEIEEKIKDINSKEKIRKYTKGKLLGRGGFAHCYEFTCQDNNKIFAAKVINKENLSQPRQKQKLLIEIKIHKSLHHNQVVAFEHNFEDKDNVYILLELCQNQTLNELLKRRKTLTEIEVQCYIIQLIKGLQYLHSHKIIHRDLKLGNLFLTDKMELKIGDFGLATKLDFDGEKKRTVCGTPNYIAPEVLSGGEHSYEVDVWAIGIIIYTLLIGRAPFESKDLNTTYKKIKEIDYKIPENAKMSYAAMKLVKRILVKNPDERPSFDEILMDDFFNQGIAIPKLLPSAALATPPSLEYIKRYIPNIDKNGISQLHQKEKLEEEAKLAEEKAKELEKEKEKEKENKSEPNKEKKTESNVSNKEKTEESSTKESSNVNVNKVNENITPEPKNEEKKEENKDKLKGPEVFITKWVDYSSKYGIGYLLNNELIGVYFNDCTKLIYNPRIRKISFIERKVTKEKDMMYTFAVNETPKELQKKVLIFQNFKKYFDEENPKKLEKMKEQKAKIKKKSKTMTEKAVKEKEEKEKLEQKLKEEKEIEKEGESVFLRKWMKTNQAIIFRLSNKTIQVIFKDRSEIILFGEFVSYKDKKDVTKVMKIEDAVNSSNFEMNKRIKYVQNIFTKIMSVNSQQK